MTRNTTALGDISELEVIMALTRSGRRLLRPLSAASRYDIAIDKGDGTLERVQCKTGRLRNGRIVFRVCSTDARRRNGVPYHGEVDAFGVYCPETGLVYLVPMTAIADCGTMSALRVDAPRNKQRKGIRLASDFAVTVSAQLSPLSAQVAKNAAPGTARWRWQRRAMSRPGAMLALGDPLK